MKRHPSIITNSVCGTVLLLSMAALPACNGNGSGEGCPAGQEDCDGVCRDVQVDPNNCGSCGNACGTGEVCSDGACTLTCPSGFTACGGTCVNLDSDHDNCGGCSDACSADEVCSGGECVISCPTGTTECSGSCVDTDTDPFNCGGCGQPCYRDEECIDGVCTATATCGDGTVDEGEACDDGNADNTDACLDTCESASCGDGYVQTGVEACDDGNADNDDACLTTCESASCGDGYVQTGVEACDDGNADNDDACLTTCEEASCGDGFVQTGVEACDDGNTTSRDGCSESCLVETSCLVTLDGGSPARLSSLSVESDGQMTLLDSVTATGNHAPSSLRPTFAQAVAACSGWIYAVISGADEIQLVTEAMDGTLTTGGTTSFTDVQGLVCDPDAGLLFAYAILPPDRMEVRSYTLDASGTPTLADSETYTMSISSYEIRNAGMPRHPVSGDLWLLAVWMDMDMMMDYGVHAARISYDAAGTLTTEQGPTEISQVDIAYSFTFSPDGSELVMPGFSGGCFAWYDLSGTTLPASGSEVVACSGPWGNDVRATVRDGSNIFYLTYSSSATIRIGEFNSSGPVDRGTATAAANASHVQLLYGDSVLVSLGRGGELRSFTSSTDGLTLTQVEDLDLSGPGYLDSSVVVACTP